jgi:hypothetical protein
MGHLMQQIATYLSRYGAERIVYQESQQTYLIEGRTHYMRFATRSVNDGSLSMADFDGGPYIELGMPAGVVLNNRVRKRISRIEQVDTGDPQLGRIRIYVGALK